MTLGEVWDVVSRGRARRRRRLERLVRHNAGHSPGGATGGVPAGRRPRRRGLRDVTVFAAAGLVLVGVLPHALDHLVARAVGADEDTAPATGSYRFLRHQPGRPGTPVTYSPCRPIHLVVNDDLAPLEGPSLLAGAMRRIHEATGLTLVLDGHTDDLPTFTGRSWNRVDRPPVLVGWTSPQQDQRLDGGVAGVGGSAAAGAGSQLYYVTGEVALDAPQLTAMLHRPGGAATVEGVLVHELGHVVGLAHVPDPRENMFAHGRSDGRLGLGDRRGLARLGQGPCLG